MIVAIVIMKKNDYYDDFEDGQNDGDNDDDGTKL